MIRLSGRTLGWWIETALMVAIMAGLIRAMWFLSYYGYLPQPFFYDPTDTWMDWFNTSIWARDRGVYDTWNTIYPPLSFVFLGIFGSDYCLVAAEGGTARDCDWIGFTALHGFYLLNVFLLSKTFLKIDRSTALQRSVALGAGLPMLYGLDRGNLVIPCFAFFALAYGPLVRSARLRWIAAAIAINFKVYLIASVVPMLLRRKWRWFEGTMIATVAVYLITFAILGLGTPMEIVRNIQDFTGVYQAVDFLDLWYAGTYGPALSLLTGPSFPVVAVLGSNFVEGWTAGLPLVLHSVQGLIMLAALGAWVRPEVVPTHRLVLFGTAFALITSEAGGYTQTLILYLALMERGRGVGRRWAIFACYLLCLPYDVLLQRIDPVLRPGYLSGQPIILEYAISLFPILRPGVIMSIPAALALVTIHDVWGDVRMQGWRDRLRFRHDLPLLVRGGGRALATATPSFRFEAEGSGSSAPPRQRDPAVGDGQSRIVDTGPHPESDARRRLRRNDTVILLFVCGVIAVLMGVALQLGGGLERPTL